MAQPDEAGRAALRQIDAVLEKRPDKDDKALTEAMMSLVEMRDALIAGQVSPSAPSAARQRLDHLNAIISVVAGVHFPLGDPPWPELEKARDWLAALTARQD